MNDELISLRKMIAHVRRLRMTAPVEDDFPQVMDAYLRHYDNHVKKFGQPDPNWLTMEDIR